MNFDQFKRDEVAQVMGQYLEQQEPTWATLWYQPSRLEPDVVKLIAVLDQPAAVKRFKKDREQIETQMKSAPHTQGLRLFVDVIPTADFHRMYQSESGFELVKEWNGDLETKKRVSVLSAWLRSRKTVRVLFPVLVACTLVWIIRAYLQAGF